MTEGEQLTAEGFLRLADEISACLPRMAALHDFAAALVEAIHLYHGAEEFEEDLTLLTVRRSA